MLFIAYCTDDPAKPDLRAETRPAHLEWLQRSAARIRVAGPFLDDAGEAPRGSLLVVEADSLDDARRFLAEDPYAKADLFVAVSLHPWKWVIGAPPDA